MRVLVLMFWLGTIYEAQSMAQCLQFAEHFSSGSVRCFLVPADEHERWKTVIRPLSGRSV